MVAHTNHCPVRNYWQHRCGVDVITMKVLKGIRNCLLEKKKCSSKWVKLEYFCIEMIS